QDKIYIFDFVRTFACFFVVLHHFLFLTLQDYYHTKFTVTGIGMEMFFFTTGFLIPLSLERCNWKQFAVKRFFRLLPVLTLAVLFYTILIKFGLINGNAKIRNILTTLTMTTDIVHIRRERLNIIVYVSWSMQVELKFYIIATLAFFFGKTMRKKFFILLSLCLLCYVITFIFKLPNAFKSSGYCFKLISCCLLGSIYYFYRYKHISKVEFAFFTMCCLFLIYYAVLPGQRISYMCGSIFVLFLVHFFTNKGNNKVVKYLANLSYSIYLFHNISVCYFGKNYPISVQSLNDIMELFLYRIIIFIPILIACHFIYYYIEKPAYDFGRRLASRIK
ncbi:MAG: acyltransferase, partial [Rickettsiales bacterium]|nr:acyltransferase [Rickettsiales bacterium]